ncbi:MAG: ABC transporter ATP-binding protein [Sandaracinaceae bacterium]|nr:ABC transporter ATP-binding protein [Sandaracinaceae bacterium]
MAPRRSSSTRCGRPTSRRRPRRSAFACARPRSATPRATPSSWCTGTITASSSIPGAPRARKRASRCRTACTWSCPSRASTRSCASSASRSTSSSPRACSCSRRVRACRSSPSSAAASDTLRRVSESPSARRESTFALRVRDLVTTFRTDAGEVRAVDGVSLEIAPGRTLGLVGESGCGKSVTALSILGLLPERLAYVESGSIELATHAGTRDLAKLDEDAYVGVRGPEISMIFQDPMSSLNPMMTVGEQLTEGLLAHRAMSHEAADARAIELLRKVGIPAPEERVHAYPHQLSGGMRQRVMIAIAIACEPKVLVADEPTTALDVTIQAQVLELLRVLRDESGMALLLITHDLAVIAEVADEVAVMYAGRIVERGAASAVLAAPHHPYTRALLRSIPSHALVPGASGEARKKLRLPTIAGTVPALGAWPSGCRFVDRCDVAIARCREEMPPLSPPPNRAEGGEVACWRGYDAGAETGVEASAETRVETGAETGVETGAEVGA